MLDAAPVTERRAVLIAAVAPNPPFAELNIEPPEVTRATVLGVLLCHSVRLPGVVAFARTTIPTLDVSPATYSRAVLRADAPRPVVPLTLKVLVPTVEPITVACVPDELPHTFRFTAEVPD
jgi:hypothetical protein